MHLHGNRTRDFILSSHMHQKQNYDAHKKTKILTSKICHMYLLNKIIFKFPEISRNAVENAWWSVKYQHVRLLGG